MDELNQTALALDEVDTMLKAINEKIEEKEKNDIDKEKMLQEINELIENFEVE